MTHDEAFLQAIIEDPDDDSLWLVYADWLEESGDPRGELVRLQYTLSRLPVGDESRPALESRARRFAAEHGDPLACLPQKAALVGKGWAKRVVRLSGRVRATVEYNGRGVGYDSVRVEGRRVRWQWQWGDSSHFEFPLPGPLGLVPAQLEARWEEVLLPRVVGLRLLVGGQLAYEEKW